MSWEFFTSSHGELICSPLEEEVVSTTMKYTATDRSGKPCGDGQDTESHQISENDLSLPLTKGVSERLGRGAHRGAREKEKEGKRKQKKKA